MFPQTETSLKAFFAGCRQWIAVKPKRTGHSIKLSLKSLIAFLIMASASLVGAQTVQTLCSFNYSNGAYPYAGLTLGNDGNFYGTTYEGGSSGYGTVFKVTTNGTLTNLVSFAGGSDGEWPYAALTLGTDGNFYGTTEEGGSGYCGTVFKVTTNGTLTNLVSFAGITYGEGAKPYAGLTLGNDGNFYGTTEQGGSSGDGTVFKVTTNGTLTNLVSFAGGSDGEWPYAALTWGTDSNFYGTTEGGSGGYGTVFKVTTNGTLTMRVSFAYTNGANPYAALTLGNDGNFYGTTEQGGSNSYGTVFKVTTNGTLTTLVSFNSTNGANPYATLTLGSDGNFYGTTYEGGSNNDGTVFKVTTNGTLTTLVSFNSTNGANPYAGLTRGSDGNFYGTTYNGGSGYGTVFRLLLPPGIIVQPKSQTNYAGATATFLVSATSLNPLGYQWEKNGTNLVNGGNISGANTNTLTITGISDSNAAIYSVIVSNANGSVTSSNATLTVNDSPFIATQPTNQTVGVGSNVTFSATAYGEPLFTSQWYYGNSPIGSPTSGTNISSCTLTNVQTNQAGNYSVHVTNSCGRVTSSNAVLTVQVFLPSIVIQPANQSALLGSSASFTVSVTGSANYQWCFNSANILNATNAIYTIQTVGTNNAGNYSVVITNSAGSVTSSNAVLTVIVPPTLALQFVGDYLQLNLTGMLNNNFVVEYSTNLADTNWFILLSLTNLPSSPYQFRDTNGVGQSTRFYRAVQLQ
jgi:uncharacterized repeat protein (TIGR03803 family)